MCRLLGRLVGSLWNVSVCFLWVCVGCLGDWSGALGMCRYGFYMCVCRLLRRLVGSLWNVSVCFFMGVCVGCLGEKEERKKGKHNEQKKERKNDKEKKRPNGRKERRSAGRKNDSEKERVEAIE